MLIKHMRTAPVGCNYFVTGTDTDVGKTVVSAWICLHTKKKYWKPIQTGSCDGRDSEFVAGIIGQDNIMPEKYVFAQASSPHLAAQNADSKIDKDALVRNVAGLSDTVIEGAGGIMVPWSTEPNYTYLDFAAETSLPTIVVASTRLGTINHTLLTLGALYDRCIDVRCLVINGPCEQDLLRTAVCFYPEIKIETMPRLKTITTTTLQNVGCCIP